MNLVQYHRPSAYEGGKSAIEMILETENCMKSTTKTNGLTHLIFTDEDYLLFITKWS